MKEIRLPRKMLEDIRKHGDPETIIPFVIRVRLDALKRSIEEEKLDHMDKLVMIPAVSLLSLFIF